MAVLHIEYLAFNTEVKLKENKKKELKKNRKALRKKIRDWFREKKPNELQPKFASQGSMEMNTINNPIKQEGENGDSLYKYDLDDGIYFLEKDGQDNQRAIDTWHDWVFQAVDGHTTKTPERKTTCVRVMYSDGHHIDLPIYYKKDNIPELAHRTKDWIFSDPKEFYEWFNKKAKEDPQLRKIVRLLKAWKNYRELKNTSLKLPSGFALTILVVNNYAEYDNLDKAFRETVRNILDELKSPFGFKCIRPTTPKGEDVFEDFSDSKKSNFITTLESLVNDCDRAKDENNFKKASEFLRDNQFGERFPLGADKTEDDKKKALAKSIASTGIVQRPYGY